MRTVSVIFFSCLLGVAIGFGSAVSALTIHAWNPELEFIRHSELVKRAVMQSTDPNAKASIESTVHDFGIRDVKEKGTQNFYIKNVGTAPLKLEVNRTTCTCTGIDLSTKTLAPGKTATAALHYDAERAMTGSYQQGGTIVTNDPENLEITLMVKGIFTTPIVLNPGNALFSNISSSKTETSKIRIYGYEKDPPLKIDTVDWKDKEHFGIKITESELSEEDKTDSMRQHARSVYVAEITVKPGLPVGTFQERFYVKTNYPSEPSFEFLARGQISGGAVTLSGIGFNKDTGVFRIGSVTRGQKMNKDLSLHIAGTATSRANLQIKEIKPDWIKVKLSDPRDLGGETSRRRLYTLSVEIPADAPTCNFMSSDESNVAMITLDTGLEEARTIKIPIQFAVAE